MNKIKAEIDEATNQYQQAEREGDYAKASEIKYGKLDKLEKDLTAQQEKLKNQKNYANQSRFLPGF